MISGIDVKATYEYVCKNDKDNPTVWILGILPSRVYRQLIAKASKTNAMELLYDSVRYGLKGFKNYKIGGKEVEFKSQKTNELGFEFEAVTLDVIDTIPLTVVSEIATEICNNSKLSELEEKN